MTKSAIEWRNLHASAPESEATSAVSTVTTRAKWYKLGTGWTSELRDICDYRCNNEFGDPPCFSLGNQGLIGGEIELINPCDDCIATASLDQSNTLVETQ
jgi:hypothetical protein